MSVTVFFPWRYWGAALCTVFCLLTACATVREPLRGRVPPTQAAGALDACKRYLTQRGEESGPRRLRASLRFSMEEGTRRVLVLLWGNGDDPQSDPHASGAVRADVMAGPGLIIAQLREAPGDFIAYSRQENRAVRHTGSGRVLFAPGIPASFGLRDLAALLEGRFDQVFHLPPEGTEAVFTAEGNLLYSLGRESGSLELRPDGLPARWEDGQGWSLAFEYRPGEDDAVLRPYKIRALHPEGHSAILIVQQRETPDASFTEEQLSLILPPGTVLEKMRMAKP